MRGPLAFNSSTLTGCWARPLLILSGGRSTLSSILAQTAILESLPLLGTILGCYETTGRL